MKIFSAKQIKDWDISTILNEPISSAMLMQRAADKAYREIEKNISAEKSIGVICGTGNNGGDGLIIARLLAERSYKVTLYIIGNLVKGSEDFKHQFKKLNIPIINLTEEEDILKLKRKEIIIDAILGSGADRKVEGILKLFIEKINSFKSFVISIDVPSGLVIDDFRKPDVCIIANLTLSFQGYKLPFFLEGMEQITGEIKLLDIRLNQTFYENEPSKYFYVDKNFISSFSLARNLYSDKKDFGHTLIVGASRGMAGASIFAAMAANKVGSGLTSILSKEENRTIYQTKIPEIIYREEIDFDFEKELGKYTSILIGPGLGMSSLSTQMVEKSLHSKIPLVIDADALNIISKNKWQKKIPKGSVITPHKREFERLFEKVEYTNLEAIQEISKELEITLLLKGRHTRIFEPGGKVYFNSTGNSSLSKAGTGDVLAGMIAGNISRYGDSLKACLLSCYLHGLSADIYVEENFEECLMPQDLVDRFPKAYRKIFKK